MNASVAFLVLNCTATSPPPTTDAGELPTAGNGNHLALSPTLYLLDELMTPATKLPSNTTADFGFFANALVTEPGKSVCSALPGEPTSVLSANSCFIRLRV